MGERWLPVPGYEGLYEVSDMGNVRSACARRGTRKGRLLRPGGKTQLSVVLHRDGAGKTRLVAHLVLEAFEGPRPPGMQTRHGPRGRLDNRRANLSYGTPAQNQGEDRVRDGTSNRGTRQWLAKLTPEIVTECRRRYSRGETQAALAAEFGVSKPTMSQAVTGARWAWVK